MKSSMFGKSKKHSKLLNQKDGNRGRKNIKQGKLSKEIKTKALQSVGKV